MASTSGASPNATVDPFRSGFHKTVCLYDWWLIKATEDFEGKKLAVGGVTSREYPEKSKSSSARQALRVFTSSPIIKRHDAFSLYTADGICVVIKGLINKERTVGNGFSSEVFNHFIFGFPPQWEERAVKYMGQEPVNDVAPLREVVAGLKSSYPTSKPSSLNQETPSNHSMHINEETNDSQILEQCSQNEPEVITDESIIKQGCQQTFEDEQEQNCGDIMNQDGDNMRKSTKPLRPPIEPNTSSSIRNLKRKQNTKEGSSNRKTKRVTQSNHSKVICDESRHTEILKECSKHVPEVSTDEGIIEEGCQQTCDVEQEQNCGDIMNQDGGCESNSNTLPQPSIEPGIAASTPGLRQKKNAKQGTPKSKIKRKINFDTPGRSHTAEAKESMSKVSSDASSFKRSRSGRLLIPHMEYWRNQVPVYDRDRSITGILEDSFVTPLRGCKTEPPKRRR